ncbi:NACHT domain-containing protein [Streptomyces sp. NBC_01498]|uniref:NACHT domain-containing protein n=1 Tax=Streptomyces sp. NBC_01498 TaxID=2975870 RepID=UPI002E7B2935|nr:NACHT domain-containing protein [Streptomyces sp. NBC_01498]WTL25498.1 NACHT domain-containing protein [Streptomyces sp. NBC_01498]
MEPGVIGARLASSVVGPLIRKLFLNGGPGAGLVDEPVRVSRLVSFRGEQRTLSDNALHRIAEELVQRALQATGTEERLSAFEVCAVTNAVTSSLRVMGTLDMDDVQAVNLGHMELARHLRSMSSTAVMGLSADAVDLHASVLDTACLHILNFFTQRSTFVPRTLLEQSRGIEELTRKIDRLITRHPSPADGPFEERYARYITDKHGKLSIFGLELSHGLQNWRLDVAYLSLDVVGDATGTIPTRLSADQVLAGHNRVLLRGVAGSGKTTLVQWLAVSTTQKDQLDLYGLVPFVLPLRTLTRGGAALPAPDEFLSAVDCPIAALQPAGWFDRVLRAGRGLILIDGIDEIPEDDRNDARRWLQELISAYPRNRWLVTSRPSAVREHWLSGDDFAEADLAPMSRDNIADFVNRWHKAAGISDQYARELLRAVRAKQDLGRLATNPLMCGLICALHQDRRGYLPEGRKEIYDAALSMLLFRRDRERGVYKPGSIRIGEAHHIQLIQKLAYWMIRNGRSEMDRADAVDLLAQTLPTMPKVAEQGTAEEIYRHLLIRSGLLREPSVHSMDFIHRTFQDYLGAKAAVEGLDFDFLIANAHLDQWEDVIRMAVAHSRPTERTRLLTGLIRRDNVSAHGMNRLHLLAAACLEHATELDPEVRAEVQQRAGALIPPRSADQARALIEVGPVVLDLLPGPSERAAEEEHPEEEQAEEPEGLPGGLSDGSSEDSSEDSSEGSSGGSPGGKAPEAAFEAAFDAAFEAAFEEMPEAVSEEERRPADQQADDEAYFTVLVATRIATDAAIDVLARYRDHHDLRVREELVRAWSQFDTDTFGQDVIAHLREDNLYFPVSNLPELHALSSYGGRARLKIAGEFTVPDLLNGCRKGRVTHLWLTTPIGESLTWVDEFSQLHSLTIEAPLSQLDVTPLAKIPTLRQIHLPQDAVVSGTAALPSSMEVVRL